MGNARVIFVGAVSVILGLYSVGLEKADRAVSRVAEVHAYQMQAEEIAKGGIALAVNTMGTSRPSQLPSMSPRPMFGGTVSYVVDDQGLPSDQARITAWGVFQGHTVKREAIVQLTSTQRIGRRKRWSNWETVKTRTTFEEGEFVDPYSSD
ncbi:MAG: hypothetical protein HBSIN02_24680 [Bacteroidia bacterium]|nr:MAG: hypothetical protein HBSIN02_24680 [Bacteroidia bacterium]